MIRVESVARCTVVTSVIVVLVVLVVSHLRQHPSRGRDAFGAADRWGAPSAGAPSSWHLSRAVIRSQIDHTSFSLLVAQGDDGRRRESESAIEESVLVVSHLRNPPSIVVGELLHWTDAVRAFPSLFSNSSESDRSGPSRPITRRSQALADTRASVPSLSNVHARRDKPVDGGAPLSRQPLAKPPAGRQPRGMLAALLTVAQLPVAEPPAGRRQGPKLLPHQPSRPLRTSTPHALPSRDVEAPSGCLVDPAAWGLASLDRKCPVSSTASPPPRQKWTAAVARCAVTSHPEAVLVLYAASGLTLQSELGPAVMPTPRPQFFGAWPACLDAVTSLAFMPDPSLRSAVASLARRRLADIVYVRPPG